MIQQELKIGDFVEGKYKCGPRHGIVLSIGKSKVRIAVYQPHYKTFTETGEILNLTKDRIREIIDITEITIVKK